MTGVDISLVEFRPDPSFSSQLMLISSGWEQLIYGSVAGEEVGGGVVLREGKKRIGRESY